MMRLVCALLVLAVATAVASESRIVGGAPTSVDDYPSIVQIQNTIGGIWRQSCAGSVITPTFTLTAASCVIGPRTIVIRRRRVIGGSSIRNIEGQVSAVADIIQHPTWNEGLDLGGDIAVIRLALPFQLTAVVQQASILAQGAFIPDNMFGVNIGWGATLNEDFPAIFSAVIQKKDVITVNNNWCAQIYANTEPLPLTVTSEMLCATAIGGGGACVGDRGGPLIINDITVGIVSWGLSCTNGSYPTVHTAIPSFTNWIVEVVNQ